MKDPDSGFAIDGDQAYPKGMRELSFVATRPFQRPISQERPVKTVLVMRHSHAVSDNPAYIDKDRPLTDAGIDLIRKSIPSIISWPVRTILASSAVRTQQTAERILPAFNEVDYVDVREDLYLATVERYVQCLKNLNADIDCAMLVGHNPSIAGLIANWSGEHLSVSPCTIAIFQFPIEEWTKLRLMNAQQPSMAAFVSKGLRIR